MRMFDSQFQVFNWANLSFTKWIVSYNWF